MNFPKHTASKELLSTKAFSVTEDEFDHGTHEGLVRWVVRHAGAVVVLPQHDDGRIVLLKQFRYAVEQAILEIPAGTLGEGEDPLECAKRELAEETGFRARDWQALGTLLPTPGFCDEVQHLFFAKGLTAGETNLDEDEILEVVEMQLSDVESAIADSVLSDSKTIATLMRARLRNCL